MQQRVTEALSEPTIPDTKAGRSGVLASVLIVLIQYKRLGSLCTPLRPGCMYERNVSQLDIVSRKRASENRAVIVRPDGAGLSICHREHAVVQPRWVVHVAGTVDNGIETDPSATDYSVSDQVRRAGHGDVRDVVERHLGCGEGVGFS